MNIKREINATIDYWLDDILFIFTEGNNECDGNKAYHEIAQTFKNIFNERINELKKELDNEEEE